MRKAYLALISRRGLEWFLPENQQVIRFLSQWVRHSSGNATCCWTVLQDGDAHEVLTRLHHGEHRSALAVLQASLTDGGTFLPEPETADRYRTQTL